MKITQSEIVDMQTVLHVELQEEDLDPYLDMGYRRLVQQTSIPGFRKGKAPRRVIEGFLGRERLLGEVVDSMLPEAASGPSRTCRSRPAAHPASSCWTWPPSPSRQPYP